jgi:predicted Zn finger-like uncharacterized protein
MNVSCPQCKTVFRVDPRKVPTAGVRARCSICGGVFEVGLEQEKAVTEVIDDSTMSPPATEPAGVEPEEAPAPTVGPDTTPTPADEREVRGEAVSPGKPRESGAPAEPKPARGPARSPFGDSDPEARTRRLARALISDVVAYHPERQDVGLREGRLKELFREEIKKAWREYVEQVGLETAKGKPYFREALNEILARGHEVF